MLFEPIDFNDFIDFDRLFAAAGDGTGGGTNTPAAGGVGPRLLCATEVACNEEWGLWCVCAQLVGFLDGAGAV